MIRGSRIPINNSREGNKRKVEDDAVFTLEEHIKRFRITHTPGEIRLCKEVRALQGRDDVQFESTEDPACVLFTFRGDSYNNCAIPTKFMMKITKYYPHHSPCVICMEPNYSAPFTNVHGEIQHSSLQEGWSAVNTIATVLELMQNLRGQYTCNSFGVTRTVTPTKLTTDRNEYGGMMRSPDGLDMES